MKMLKELGLTKYEISIYRSLLENGRSDAKRISSYSHVPQTAVYPNLNSLIDKQLIQRFKGDVSLFEALPPTIALDVLAENKKRMLTAAKDAAVKQSQKLLHSKMIGEPKEVLSVTKGRLLSAAVYMESLRKSKKTYYILGWRLEKIKDKYEFLKEFRKALKRGVDVRIILIGPMDKQWQLIDAYMKAGIKIKYLPLDNFSIFVADSKECKFTLKNKKMPDRFNIHILDSSLAKAMNNYFLDMWDDAKDIRKIREKII